MTTCERCGHMHGSPVFQRLGASVEDDLLIAAFDLLRMHEARENKECKPVLAVVDALWLAVKRGDHDALERFARLARGYTRSREHHWAPPVRFGSNATVMRRLITEAEAMFARRLARKRLGEKLIKAAKAAADEQKAMRATEDLEKDLALIPGMFALKLLETHRYLPGCKGGKPFAKLKQDLAIVAEEVGGDAEHFVVRALIAAGMPVKEAHQTMAFRRQARSRETRKRLPKRKR